MDFALKLMDFVFIMMDFALIVMILMSSQAQRAEAYELYIRTALKNQQCVGAHWFQYLDEPTAGRADGENYQIGWVDLADTPYAEMVAAGRKLASTMYTIATSAGLK